MRFTFSIIAFLLGLIAAVGLDRLQGITRPIDPAVPMKKEPALQRLFVLIDPVSTGPTGQERLETLMADGWRVTSIQPTIETKGDQLVTFMLLEHTGVPRPPTAIAAADPAQGAKAPLIQ